MPRSLEGYYQETGRAGRDGQEANAWMVYNLADVVAVRQMLATSEGDELFKRVQQRRVDTMLGYCETTRCRRQVLLGYFSEDLPEPCGNCDVCLEGVETWDGTVAAQKALSCVYRTGQRFGAGHLTDVLLGKDTVRTSRFGHDQVSTFGIGTELSANEWKSVFRQLVAAGLLSVDLDYGGFRLSPECRSVLRGEQEFELRKDPIPTKKAPKPKRHRSDSRVDWEDMPNDADSMALWEDLRALRREIASAKGVPAYHIFHDKTLQELVKYRPQSLVEMEQIYGIGLKKLELYGEQFLKLIQRYGQHEGTLN